MPHLLHSQVNIQHPTIACTVPESLLCKQYPSVFDSARAMSAIVLDTIDTILEMSRYVSPSHVACRERENKLSGSAMIDCHISRCSTQFAWDCWREEWNSRWWSNGYKSNPGNPFLVAP